VKLNAQLEVVQISNQGYALNCDTTSAGSNNIIWIQTIDQDGLYYSELNNRVYTTNNGRVLNFYNVTTVDEEYYACGYVNSEQDFVLLKSYYIKVEGF
jgi:hypothetical protein